MVPLNDATCRKLWLVLRFVVVHVLLSISTNTESAGDDKTINNSEAIIRKIKGVTARGKYLGRHAL